MSFDPFGSFGSGQECERQLAGELLATLDPAASRGVSAAAAGRYDDPTGFRMRQAADDLAAWLLSDDDAPRVPASVEDLCRVKALQDDKPSSALKPLYDLKPRVLAWLRAHEGPEALSARAVKRAELAFWHSVDCYLRCREDLYRLRLDEVRREVKMMQRHLDNLEREKGIA
ncbi:MULTISPECIES: hypothetical protein [unclassified Adlercreutzia]|uniref:hypothetical protein n=1 Tax=unclassified Adlercreutzia TaxID=2636013 RepID=UPI0013EAF9B0|nr:MULTISPECIES: hypothetical protein [unclassified Adlercreutzia]